MSENLNKEKLIEFENTILNPEKTGEIKYSIDRGIEASVRYDFLSDSYGIQKVKSVLDEMDKTFLDLSEGDVFSEVSERLLKK